jgi:endonuclease/exonuclease/phosphatase (EEP) superfamily protein YafD
VTLRILTANLYNGRAKPDGLVAALRSLRPDVVAVQELSENAAAVLADWGVSRLLEPDDSNTGMGVALNTEATFDRLEFPHRNPVRASFDGAQWGFKGVEVVGTHLVNPISWPWNESRRLRTAEANALEQLLGAPAATRAIVGDFNSSPAWPLYRRLRGLASDAAVAAGTARATWGYFPWSPAMLRIDHAFIQGARSLRTRPVRIPGSDHRALVVDLAPLEA